MAKQVFNTDAVTHIWAHRTQSSARNKQGNLFFADATIYSYGRHFPIAAHVVNKKGIKAVILTNNRYSNTTTKHIDIVRRAIPPGVRIFVVNLGTRMLPIASGELSESACNAIIDDYQLRITRLAKSAIQARTANKIKEWLDSAVAQQNKLLAFVELFGLPKLTAKARIQSRKLPFIPETVDAAKALGKAAKLKALELAKAKRIEDAKQRIRFLNNWMAAHPDYAQRWNGTIQNADTLYLEWKNIDLEVQRERNRIEHESEQLTALLAWMDQHPDELSKWDGERDQGRRLQREFEKSEQATQQAKRVADWLAGENVSASFGWNLPTMLRVKGDNVETSRGVNFPVSHARRGLALIDAVLASGQEWKPNGKTCHLGHYQIDRIEPNGTVHAGCHVVSLEAINRIREAIVSYVVHIESNQECA